jgi:mannose-6-phosphate isomerase
MFERARMLAQQKPWGVLAPDPSSGGAPGTNRIGEIWYEPANDHVSGPDLLLKLLFTSQPLSIQVHPTDQYAQSIGLPNGKTEAWYVLSAEPGAQVAVGLKAPVNEPMLRDAILDGSIADHIAWRDVHPHDVVFVPAGTIHAIGGGLVIAEIQQRSDATFRLFDHGSARTLHVDQALAVSEKGPADDGITPKSVSISEERVVLVANDYFVFERIELPPHSTWLVNATRETWLLLLSAEARVGAMHLRNGDAIYAQSDRFEIESGGAGLQALVAYTGVGGPLPQLLERLGKSSSSSADRQREPRQSPAAPTINLGAHP